MPTSSDGTLNPAPSTSSGSTKKGRGGKRKKNTGRPDDHPKHPAPGDPSSVGSGANRNRKCNGNRRLLSCDLLPAYWFALTVLMVAFMVLRRGSTRISGFSQATPGAAGSRDFKAKVRQNTAAEETSLDSSSNARDEECISTKPNSFFSWSFPWSFPKLEAMITQFIESPIVFPEAPVTRFRRRALQEMQLNDEPLQDNPPRYVPPGYTFPSQVLHSEIHLRAERERHRAVMRAVQPIMLNGREQDCVSPRCLRDGTYPAFRKLERKMLKMLSPESLCVFILDWGRGEIEYEREAYLQARPQVALYPNATSPQEIEK